MNKKGFSTTAIHAGQKPDAVTGSVMTPVYLTSTYAQESIGRHKGYEYSRVSNPTRDALESNVAAMENGKYGAAFASGMAAIDAVMYLLKPGDHVIMTSDVYGGTYRAARLVYEDYGLKFTFTDTTDIKNVKKSLTKKPKCCLLKPRLIQLWLSPIWKRPESWRAKKILSAW